MRLLRILDAQPERLCYGPCGFRRLLTVHSLQHGLRSYHCPPGHNSVVSQPVLTCAPRSPYARLNLRRNPFGELTRQERAELAVVDVDRWLGELTQDRTALQFLGPCGHGKTTHLLALGRMLPEAVYVYLPEDGPLPHVPAIRPLLLDEAQRLRLRQREQVFAQGGPLLVASHEDHTRELSRAGYRVVTEHVARAADPQRLQRLLNRRIDASRAGSGPVPWIGQACAIDLHRRFGADIRQIERVLYDEFQRRFQENVPWPNAI